MTLLQGFFGANVQLGTKLRRPTSFQLRVLQAEVQCCALRIFPFKFKYFAAFVFYFAMCRFTSFVFIPRSQLLESLLPGAPPSFTFKDTLFTLSLYGARANAHRIRWFAL